VHSKPEGSPKRLSAWTRDAEIDDLHNWPASRCFLPESASSRRMEHLPIMESSMLTSYGKNNHANKDSRHSELASCKLHVNHIKLCTLLRASTHANSFGRTHHNGPNFNKRTSRTNTLDIRGFLPARSRWPLTITDDLPVQIFVRCCTLKQRGCFGTSQLSSKGSLSSPNSGYRGPS